MPLARIITDHPENSRVIAEQLQLVGFEVETVSPAHKTSTAADFEIHLEECNSEEALRKAAENTASDSFSVFISPGTLANLSLLAGQGEASAPASAVVSENTILLAASPLTEAAELTEETRTGPEWSSLISAAALSTSEDNPLRAMLDAHDFRLPEAVLALSDVIEDAENEDPALSTSLDGADATQDHRQPTPPEETVSPVEEHTSPATLDQDKVPLEAVAASEAPSDWPIWRPVEEELPVAVAVSSAEAVVDQAPSPTTLVRKARARLHFGAIAQGIKAHASLLLNAGIVLAGAACVLLLTFSYHRFSPLPRSWSQTQQPLPFGRSATNAESVTSNPDAASAQAIPASRSAPAPTIASNQHLTGNAQSGSSTQPPAKPTNSGAANATDDFVAKDTVIHFGRRPAPRKLQAQVPGIKYYSDMK